MSEENREPDAYRALTPQEQAARNRRNLLIAAALIGFMVVVFVVTVVRLQDGALQRPF
jgi:hypothetical protein